MGKVHIWLMIVWSTNVVGQQSFFLDSLFKHDLSGIENVETQYRLAEINRLRSDWGISAGVSITNSFQDEIDAGLSTRIQVQGNLLSGGFFDNQKDAEILEYEMKVDSLKGMDRAYDHNYGIFYDYIIYLYNDEKIIIADSIIVGAESLNLYFNDLYFNKLIDYTEIIKLLSTQEQFSVLKQSMENYNDLFASILDGIELPVIDPCQSWQVDFPGIFLALENDTTLSEALALQNEILDLKNDKINAPNLSLALGYDISRDRPYYRANFSIDLKRNHKHCLEAKKLQLSNNHRLEQVRLKKELLNLQYEYHYKEKQKSGVKLKLVNLMEEKRKYEVKREILSLTESIQEKKLIMDKMLMEYEMIDLQQQQMLLLLRIKKMVRDINIGNFIRLSSDIGENKKFAGNRLMLIDPSDQIAKNDLHFLNQNEISPVTASDLILLKNIELIDPDQYETRGDLEESIAVKIELNKNTNFLFPDIDSLKKLELRTLRQKEFDLTVVTK